MSKKTTRTRKKRSKKMKRKKNRRKWERNKKEMKRRKKKRRRRRRRRRRRKKKKKTLLRVSCVASKLTYLFFLHVVFLQRQLHFSISLRFSFLYFTVIFLFSPVSLVFLLFLDDRLTVCLTHVLLQYFFFDFPCIFVMYFHFHFNLHFDFFSLSACVPCFSLFLFACIYVRPLVCFKFIQVEEA